MAKDFLSGAMVFIVGFLIVILLSSTISSSPEQSYQMGVVGSILYLASIIFVTSKKK
jgi:hypothetical protein